MVVCTSRRPPLLTDIPIDNSLGTCPWEKSQLTSIHKIFYCTKRHLFNRTVLNTRQLADQAGAYPGFGDMKRLGLFHSPLDGIMMVQPGQGSNPDRSIRSPLCHLHNGDGSYLSKRKLDSTINCRLLSIHFIDNFFRAMHCIFCRCENLVMGSWLQRIFLFDAFYLFCAPLYVVMEL